MGSPEINHQQRSVQLNGDPGNQPLKDVVICCTAVPEERRVSRSDIPKPSVCRVKHH
jgi:hypothetical protein